MRWFLLTHFFFIMNIELPEKLYYSIGEVARAFDVNTSLIRYWEKEFDVLKPKKNKKGNRYFTQRDIQNLRKIYFLVKEKGYTLEGAKDELHRHERLDEQLELIQRLKYIRSELISIKESFD